MAFNLQPAGQRDCRAGPAHAHTRQPLKIPVLTRKYWGTFDDSSSPLPGRDLARILEIVHTTQIRTPLTTTAGLGPAEALKLEDDLITRSIAYARKNLSL